MKELDIVIVIKGKVDGKPATFTNISSFEEECMIVVIGDSGFCFNWNDAVYFSDYAFRSNVQNYLDANTPTQRGLATKEIRYWIEEVLIEQNVKFHKVKLDMKTLMATTDTVDGPLL